jgi:hypothetical protein
MLLKIGRSTVGIRSNSHAAATTSRHACMADALKTRCILADVRWRWTLKVSYVAAWVERNLCADPTLLKPCIFRSLRRVGRCEFSARLLRHRPRSWRLVIPRSPAAAGLLLHSHMNAGQDGFPNPVPNKSATLNGHWHLRSVSGLGSIDHTISSSLCKFWHRLGTVAVLAPRTWLIS